MDKFYYAIAATGAASARLKTQEEAETWGRNFLAKTPTVQQVFIAEGLGVVERDSPPIKFTPVKNGQNEPQLGFDETGLRS